MKEVNKSLLERGFTVPVDVQEILSFYLSGGRLQHGEKRTIKIFLDGKSFDATLTSVNFNRKNYPDHKEMWQIVYAKTARLPK